MSGLQTDACASSTVRRSYVFDVVEIVEKTRLNFDLRLWRRTPSLTRNERLREDMRPLESCLRASTGHRRSGRSLVLKWQ